MKTNTIFNLKKLEYILWIVLFVSSLISVLSNLDTIISGGKSERSSKWMEIIILPFYFTNQSNFLALAISFLMVFKIIKNPKSIKTFSIFMMVNLFVTFVIYWVVLFKPTRSYGVIGWISNIFLHAIVPLFGVMVFFVRYSIKENRINKNNIFKKSGIHLIYPLVWMLMAIWLYFVFGANDKDAIYPFLRLKTRWKDFIMYLFIIGIFYYLLSLLAVAYSNPWRKLKRKI